MDDATVGHAIRALRQRRGWTQAELAAAAGVSQSLVSRAERGHLETLSIRSVRAMFAALDAGCTLAPWWRSGQLDRLLDEAHAALTERTVDLLRRAGWQVSVEVTFAVYGERGSIDVLGLKPAERRALVTEVKPTITSSEETNRTLDRKTRLATAIVQEREGWRPTSVGRLLVVGDGTTNRRRIARSGVFEVTFPIRGHAVAAWLRGASGGGSALLFVPSRTGGTGGPRTATPERVRKPSSRTKRATDSPTGPAAGRLTAQPVLDGAKRSRQAGQQSRQF
jgi:transcriptional regulator with XRE-family HTH domain